MPSPLQPLYGATLVVLGVSLRVLRVDEHVTATVRAPRWDLPARMATGTVAVLALTAVAPLLGPRLSGLVTAFPIFASVLAVFAHRQHGAGAAAHVLRGLLFGLFAFATFFLVVALVIERAGVAAAFAGAILAAAAIQGGSLRVLRRSG